MKINLTLTFFFLSLSSQEFADFPIILLFYPEIKKKSYISMSYNNQLVKFKNKKYVKIKIFQTPKREWEEIKKSANMLTR